MGDNMETVELQEIPNFKWVISGSNLMLIDKRIPDDDFNCRGRIDFRSAIMYMPGICSNPRKLPVADAVVELIDEAKDDLDYLFRKWQIVSDHMKRTAEANKDEE
jgi:hypothetical protein